jgi:hippurate hydrolase
VVVTVGSLHAGTRRNVIPESATFEATVRTFSDTARAQMRESAPRLLRGIAAAHGVDVAVDYVAEYPLTVTDADETAFVAATVGEVFGADRYESLAHPLGGSEDFSRVLDAVPGGFVGLGAVPSGLDPDRAPFNHAAHARYDDTVLPEGAAMYAELARRRLDAFRTTDTTDRSQA